MINNYIALDIETSGLNPASDKIIEIGMAKVIDGRIEDKYSCLINPQEMISERITQLTGITQQMLNDKPVINDVIFEIIDFMQELPILGHNVIFDYSFIKKAAVNNNIKFERQGIDTLKLARRLLPEVEHKNLEYLCRYFNIDAGNSHRAYDDAVSAIKIFNALYCIKPDDNGFDELITLNYQVKKDSPITQAQKRYLLSLIEKHGIILAQDVEALTKSKASKLIDGIIGQYGK